MFAARQVLIDGDGDAFSVSDAVDDEARAEHAIAARKDARGGGHQGFAIGHDEAARRYRYAIVGL
jgi:hypothetical protein